MYITNMSVMINAKTMNSGVNQTDEPYGNATHATIRDNLIMGGGDTTWNVFNSLITYTDNIVSNNTFIPDVGAVVDIGESFTTDTTTFIPNWTVKTNNGMVFRFIIPSSNSNDNLDPSGATTAIGLRVNNKTVGNYAYAYQSYTLHANTYTLKYNWVVNVGSALFNLFPNCVLQVYFGNTLIDSFQPSQIMTVSTRTANFTLLETTAGNLMFKLVMTGGAGGFGSQTIALTSVFLLPNKQVRNDVLKINVSNYTPSTNYITNGAFYPLDSWDIDNQWWYFTTDTTTYIPNWTVKGLNGRVSVLSIPTLNNSNNNPDPNGSSTAIALRIWALNAGNYTYAYQTHTLPANTYTLKYNWVVNLNTSNNTFTNCVLQVYFGATLIDSFQPSKIATFTTRTAVFTLTETTTDNLMFKLYTTGVPATLDTIHITSVFLTNPAVTTGSINLTPNGGVGIKTDTPLYDLDVNGDCNTAGVATFENKLTVSANINSVLPSVVKYVGVSLEHNYISLPIPRIIRVSGASGCYIHLAGVGDTGVQAPSGTIVTLVVEPTSGCDFVGSFTELVEPTVETETGTTAWSHSISGGTVVSYYYNSSTIRWCRL